MYTDSITSRLSEPQTKFLQSLTNELNRVNGKAYIVGGFIRDSIDSYLHHHYTIDNGVDVEVFGVTFKELQSIVSKLTLTVTDQSNNIISTRNGIHLSIPRRDIFENEKYTYEYCPDFTIEQAARRRDLSINSLYFDFAESKLIDPCGGILDLENKVVRAINIKHFSRDPERYLRSLRFASKLNYRIDSKIRKKKISFSLRSVSEKFLYNELTKVFMQSPFPSDYFTLAFQYHPEWFRMDSYTQEFLFMAAQWRIDYDDFKRIQKGTRVPNSLNKNFQLKKKARFLENNGYDYKQLDILAEQFENEHIAIIFELLGLTKDVPQSKTSHPEGDVWTHSLMALDMARLLKEFHSNPLRLMFTMLLHDVGKSCFSVYKNSDQVVATEHEVAGAIMCSYALKNVLPSSDYYGIIDFIEHHMFAMKIKRSQNPRKYYFSRLDHFKLSDLSVIHHCDLLGRGTYRYECYFLELAQILEKEIGKRIPVYWQYINDTKTNQRLIAESNKKA